MALAAAPLTAAPDGATPAEDGPWRRIVINDQSPYEAAGAADFNGDGQIDVLSGSTLYLGPQWKPFHVREAPPSDPSAHYYEDFNDLPLDVNGDGRVDVVTCTYFTRRVGWVENPPDATKPWVEHEIDAPGSSETGQLVDLDADGKPDFLPNCVATVVWYELEARKPEVRWTKHELGKEGAGHGVGVGDVNGDGRTDVICPGGWYEQPADSAAASWNYHKEFDLGAAGILILGHDVDGDGKTDIVWGMGHNFGLYCLRQKPSVDGKRAWVRETIDATFSQVHTLLLADLDGDGTPEVVTGKRVYAHEAEPGATDAPIVASFRLTKKHGTWQKRILQQGQPAANAPAEAKERRALKDFARGSVGTGLQMQAVDIDGDLDLLCPGKSGLYVLENPRQGVAAGPAGAARSK
jgi:hypothetical protein